MCVCVYTRAFFIVIFATLSSLTSDALLNHRQNRNEIRTAISVDFPSDDGKSEHISSTRAHARERAISALARSKDSTSRVGQLWSPNTPFADARFRSVSGLSQRRSRPKFIPLLEIEVIHRGAAGDRLDTWFAWSPNVIFSFDARSPMPVSRVKLSIVICTVRREIASDRAKF